MAVRENRDCWNKYRFLGIISMHFYKKKKLKNNKEKDFPLKITHFYINLTLLFWYPVMTGKQLIFDATPISIPQIPEILQIQFY